jgi:hypothetical protein
MKKQLLNISILILLVFTECSKETELRKSIFIPDHDFPSLPAYTEWGYNTFGAFYDREIFTYNDYDVPAKVINTGGKTSFTLKGQKGSSYYYDYTPMSMTFDLYGFSPESISDLIALNDTIIDLTNVLCKVSVIIDTVKYQQTILNGILEFKRAQNLIVDKKQVEVILSGTFEFQSLVGNEPISLTLGRFDIGISRDTFFKY